MSSVLIRGMEMPECCNKCNFGRWSSIHQTAACERHGYDPCFEDYSREHLSKRAHFCPLVEVKEPHGKLIDASELNMYDVSPVSGFCVIGATEEDIELADAVIEAEGSEE